MDQSEKEEKSSDMRTSISSPKELGSGGKTTNVFPPLTPPPDSDQVKDDPAPNLQSSASSGIPQSPDREQLSQSNLSITDHTKTSSWETSSSPQQTRAEVDDDVGESKGPPEDLIGRSGGPFPVFTPSNSPPAKKEKQTQGNLSSTDQASTSSSQRRPSLLTRTKTVFLAGYSSQSVLPVTKTDGRVSGDGMQAHAPTADSCDEARYEALVIEGLTAIEKKDSKALLLIVEEARTEFLDRVPDMFISMSEKNPRTVLHVSAMQGCFPLAKKVLDLVKGWSEPEPEVWKDYIERVDPESGLTAFQMVFDITGNRSIAEYINHTLQFIHHPHMSEQTYPFYEAYTSTTWWKYEIIMNYESYGSLRWNSRRLLETWCHGLTVLHVAILSNNLLGVRSIMEVFGSQKKVVWGDSYYPSALSWEQMLMLPGKRWDNDMREGSELYSDPIILSRVQDSDPIIISRVQDLQKSISRSKLVLQSDATALELAEELGFADIVEALRNYGNDGVTQSTATQQSEDERVTMIHSLMSDENAFATSRIIDELLQWKKEWEKGFEEDVDFNFEEEPRLSLLRLHYICKDPSKFKDLIKVALSDVPLPDFNLYKDCNSIFDGQGRTPFHIFLDCSNAQGQVESFEKIFGDINHLVYIEDAKGRSLLHVFFMKNYSHNVHNCTKLWDDEDEMKYLKKSSYSMLLMKFQLALYMKQSKLATKILKKILQKQSPIDASQSHPLLIAASYGNQAILRLILDGTSNPMVTDNKNRTALHHAADASLLDPPYILAEFYSTVEDLCKDKRMWKEEREKANGILKANNSIDTSTFGQDEISNVERKACILMLVQAGVDLFEADNEGKVPNIGPSVDATLQSWWYDMVVKDATDNKNSFNQAGNALSVVGALVAATSYVGPLQPPMNYIEGGYVHMGEKLIEIFMVTNTLAFYFAMASVMFAVVPSLPMPREGVMSELKRARRTVSLSLCFLLIATSMIIISFAAASMAVIHDQHSFHRSNLLFVPSIIGWSICLFASLGFLLRVMTLIYYKKPMIRRIYQFSLTNFCKKVWRSWKYYFIYFSSFRDELKEFMEFWDNHVETKLRACFKDERIIIPISIVVLVVTLLVWLVCWPLLHYVYVLRNFERFENSGDKNARVATRPHNMHIVLYQTADGDLGAFLSE